ncbi:MAG: hypothetical protein A3F11_07085 [Gammaproteobacteria bacterium RIFCSPHIGHO2_12_FULL_37_14]|nr:MAG: hypothetical protein A3F11_07085 [Gammaproteobacteria bacterium RIFCSPHIGHO2_12_FULL_37_14]
MKENDKKNSNQHDFKYRLLSITVIFSIVLILFFITINISDFAGIHHLIFDLNDFIKNHQLAFLLWHILIIITIYAGWGFKVNKDAKKFNLSNAQTKKAKQFRYWMIAFIVIFDLLTHLY